jgi:hypothetical protein
MRKRSFKMSGAKKQLAMSAKVPRGATTEAGANAYDMKLPVSPMFIKMNPDHHIFERK